MLRFTIRDLLWLTLVVGITVGWRGRQVYGGGEPRSFAMVRWSRSHRPLIGQEMYGHPQHRIWESARLLRVAAFV